MRRAQMMWRVTAGWHISDGNELAKCVVIKRVSCKEVLVLIIASSCPEVSYFLGPEARVKSIVWRTIQCRCGDLEDG